MKSTSVFGKIISILIVLALMLSTLLLAGCTKKNNEEEEEQEQSNGLPVNGPYENEKAEEGRSDFIEDLGGVSETYVGSVSEVTFVSAEDAAKAFINEEVVGKKEASIESVTAKGTLSSKEVTNLKLPDDVKEGMLGVEKYEVKYSVNEQETAAADGVMALSAAQSDDTVVIVYIIKYENYWKYYSPAPVSGNTITKSYYDSVFNAEKYKNCTLESEMTITMELVGTYEGETETVNMEVSTQQLIKYADNKLYAEIYTKTYMSQGVQENNLEQTIYLYLEETSNGLLCYVKTSKDDKWNKSSLSASGFSSIEELTPFYDQYLDYSYFTKTSFGFAIEEENAKFYLEETATVMEQIFPDFFSQDNIDIEMYAEYYVSNGVLSGMRADATVDLTFVEDGVVVEVSETVYGLTTVTDYGTTVVESPV